MATKVTSWWDATSFVPEKAQWNNPHATPLVETDVGQMVGHLPGQGCRRLASVKRWWAYSDLQGWSTWGLLLSLWCFPMGEVVYIGSFSDPGLACRSSESTGCMNQDLELGICGTSAMPGSWWTSAFAMDVALKSRVWVCEGMPLQMISGFQGITNKTSAG